MQDLGLSEEIINKIIADVKLESQRQIEKWGEQDHISPEWMLILNEEVGELNKAVLEDWFNFSGNGNMEECYKEAIQVATLSIKIAVMFANEMEIRE